MTLSTPRILWILAFAQLFCSLGWGQSIADIARRERNRQRQLESKTITVPPTGVTATTAATSSTGVTVVSSGTTSATAVTTGGFTDNQGHDEKYWRSAFQKAREDSKRAGDRVQVLQLQLTDLNAQFLNRNDIFNKENVLGPQITATQKALDEARKTDVQAKQKISDLEEELRRAGGPAGWAR